MSADTDPGDVANNDVPAGRTVVTEEYEYVNEEPDAQVKTKTTTTQYFNPAPAVPTS